MDIDDDTIEQAKRLVNSSKIAQALLDALEEIERLEKENENPLRKILGPNPSDPFRIPVDFPYAPPYEPVTPAVYEHTHCGTCKIPFKDMGLYVCPRTDCPSRITWTDTTTGDTNPE